MFALAVAATGCGSSNAVADAGAVTDAGAVVDNGSVAITPRCATACERFPTACRMSCARGCSNSPAACAAQLTAVVTCIDGLTAVACMNDEPDISRCDAQVTALDMCVASNPADAGAGDAGAVAPTPPSPGTYAMVSAGSATTPAAPCAMTASVTDIMSPFTCNPNESLTIGAGNAYDWGMALDAAGLGASGTFAVMGNTLTFTPAAGMGNPVRATFTTAGGALRLTFTSGQYTGLILALMRN